jgi:hypothetical protein
MTGWFFRQTLQYACLNIRSRKWSMFTHPPHNARCIMPVPSHHVPYFERLLETSLLVSKMTGWKSPFFRTMNAQQKAYYDAMRKSQETNMRRSHDPQPASQYNNVAASQRASAPSQATYSQPYTNQYTVSILLRTRKPRQEQLSTTYIMHPSSSSCIRPCS